VEVVVGDAYTYLCEQQTRFDVVIDDLYHACGDDVERPFPITPEHLKHHLSHLSPQGSLVMNFVVGTGHQEIFEQACSTFSGLFPQVRRILPPYSYNEILVGSRHSAPLRTRKGLESFSRQFNEELDREHWKELRTLKLRSP
jgi:spermidine synthase